MYRRSNIDCPLKLNVLELLHRSYKWIRNDKNFEKGDKDNRRKQELEFYLWDLRIARRKNKKSIKLIYLIMDK